MKRVVIYLAILIFTAVQVEAQEQKRNQNPDEQITVNKKYDENGNLIQFDSTYVRRWSSDTTMQFAFPDHDFFAGKGFPDIDQFLHDFMSDSILGFQHGVTPFNRDEFFKPFRQTFPDSMLQNFSFRQDSLYFDFPMDSLPYLPPGFMPDFNELMQGLHDHLGSVPNSFFDISPKFLLPEQQNEWQQLMEKHRKEMEEFKKKWDMENNYKQ